MRENLVDVFHCNLLQIEPSHLIEYHQQQKVKSTEQERNKSSDHTVLRQFSKPHTRITIPTFSCDHRDVDLASRNILLEKCFETSKLSKVEHSACLQAILKLKSNESALSTEDKGNRSTYIATIHRRFDEKSRFLAFLKRKYYATLSYRYHLVQPAIDSFITQKWKRQLLELLTSTKTDAYRLITALKVHRQMDAEINAELIYQEHFGNIPRMLCDVTILRQSSENLLSAYQRQRSEQFINFIRGKSIEIGDANQVNAIVPLSVIKLFISDYDIDWSVRMTVNDTASSTILNPIKQITFEKPLPPLYLSGNERKMRGNKYVMRTTVCPQHTGSFCHSTKTISDPVSDSDEVIECTTSNDNQYKLHTIDEICEKYSTECDPIANGSWSFRIWNISNIANDSIRLMVPAKTDAFRVGENVADIEMVNLSSKLEFQAEYGAEVMTKAELLREWCHQYFRPGSVTVRCK